MYLTFKDFQSAYTAITNPLPNYTANSTIFVNALSQIQSFSQLQRTSRKGVADNKKLLKNNLIVLTGDYFRKLTAYAKFTNNATLAQEVKMSEGKLKQLADTAVRDYGQIAYDKAQPIVGSLAPYGITAATQTALLNAITAYNAALGKPGVSRTEGGQTTKQLKALFKTAETALSNMDAAVEIVRLTQPNFYSAYQKARKVITNGTSALSVKGLVTDATNGEPLKGVTVSFMLDGGVARAKSASSNAKADFVKKTADKGGFNVKGLPAGIYNVSVKKVGYAEKMTTVAVSDGEMTELNIQLSKN